jgi:carbon storage regulator CsrA
MLVLTRHVGEQIVIDSAIRVTVVAIKGNNVRLGVTAPEYVRVDRAEVHQRRGPPGGPGPGLSLSFQPPKGDSRMRTVQQGDRVQVHYVKRFQDGSVASSRSRGHGPLELTIGTDHPRLPGLGLVLVGLAPGTSTTVSVPPELAYGVPDPARVRRWARTRFAKDQPLPVGKWVQVSNRQGRRRRVRILEVRGQTVVVDTNHRWAGQALELEVELISIQTPDTGLRGQEP